MSAIDFKLIGECTHRSIRCDVYLTKYHNEQHALQLIEKSTGQAWATASVCLPSAKIWEDEVFIKDYSENEGMILSLQQANIIGKEPRGFHPSGHVQIPVFELLRT